MTDFPPDVRSGMRQYADLDLAQSALNSAITNGDSSRALYAENTGDGAAPQEAPANPLVEYAQSVWHAAVTKKAQGVGQLFGADVNIPKEEPRREGINQIAHIAGEATGEIIDFVIMTKLAGRLLNKVPGMLGSSKVGTVLAESAVARNAANGGIVGFVNGSILTPTREGESGWNRLGHGVVEAGTFATLGGVATKYSEALTRGFLSRVKANAVAGGAAGFVNSNLDAWTHGKLASVEGTLMNTAGWAVGNIAFGEGAHVFGKGMAAAKQHFRPNLSADARLSMMRQAAEGAPNGGKPKGEGPSGQTVLETAITGGKAPAEIVTAKATGEGLTGAASEEAIVTASIVAGERATTDVAVKAGKQAAEKVAAESTTGRSGESTTGRVSDRLPRPHKLEPAETISMRELAERNDPAFDEILAAYHKQLQRTFPLEGEIEAAETYAAYLKDKSMTWDMVVLRDAEKNIIGGIQYQIVEVGGQNINKAAWGEHIWLAPEARNYDNFRGLIKIAEERIKKSGGDLVFMEFNNPEKMTPAQILEDSAAGISPADREKVWGRVGIHVPVDSVGRMPEYGQPSMDGQPAVEFLSLGFIGSKPLTGKSITASDYLRLARSAHSTIPGVDVNSDPTIKAYTEAVQAMDDKVFTFVPLAAIARARQAALSARTESMTQSIVDSIAKSLSADIEIAVSEAAAANAGAVPDSLKKNLPDAIARALRLRVVEALKSQNPGG